MKIFINYRRSDSAAEALNVAQYLERECGRRSIFIDIDRIESGQNFRSVLAKRLAACDVMLAVIGPNWLEALNENGTHRLDDPDDWVRVEIASALARRIPVIPVLVGGASLPKQSALPDELKPLLDQQASVITTNNFRDTIVGLVRAIRLLQRRRPWGKIVAAATVIAFSVGIVVESGLMPKYIKDGIYAMWPSRESGRAEVNFSKQQERGAESSTFDKQRQVIDQERLSEERKRGSEKLRLEEEMHKVALEAIAKREAELREAARKLRETEEAAELQRRRAEDSQKAILEKQRRDEDQKRIAEQQRQEESKRRQEQLRHEAELAEIRRRNDELEQARLRMAESRLKAELEAERIKKQLEDSNRAALYVPESPPSLRPACGWYAIAYCSKDRQVIQDFRIRFSGTVANTNDKTAYPNFAPGWYCLVEGPTSRDDANGRVPRMKSNGFDTAYIKNAC